MEYKELKQHPKGAHIKEKQCFMHLMYSNNINENIFQKNGL